MSGSGTPSQAPRVVELRRRVHARPELAFTEIETAALVVSRLRGVADDVSFGADCCRIDDVHGLPSRHDLGAARDRARARGVPDDLVSALGAGRTGVVARLRGSRPGPTTAIRFDMDALPVRESESPDHAPRSAGFASTLPGQMHACGHDGHVAIGIELGLRLGADHDFPGEVVLLFQPAEEGVRGAATLVAAGATRGVDRLIGLHLGIGLPVGTVAASAQGLLATEKWIVSFRGRAAHAALSPEEGRHAVLGAATAALNLHTIAQVGQGSARVNVGALHGGTATNIVPESAELWCEVRADAPETFDLLRRRAHDVVAGAAGAYGLEVDVEVTGSALTIRCDRELAEELGRVAETMPSVSTVRYDAAMVASDDVTVLMADVQRAGGLATLVLVGAGSPAPHHHERFDLDERCLDIAVDWLEMAIRGSTAK